MKNGIVKIGMAALIAASLSVQAHAKTHSKSIIVVSPPELPEIAQRKTDAMYLHYTGDGRAVLYLEQDQGRSLGIVDVSNPAAIRTVGQATIAAPSTYDFLFMLRDSAVLIRYRNHSGFAVINLKKFKEPVLTEAPQFQHPGWTEALGDNGLLLVSTTSPSAQVAEVEDSEYEVFEISDPSKPTTLANVQGVRQRLERAETGTLFLLGDAGITVVRRLAAEEEYEAELNQQRGN